MPLSAAHFTRQRPFRTQPTDSIPHQRSLLRLPAQLAAAEKFHTFEPLRRRRSPARGNGTEVAQPIIERLTLPVKNKQYYRISDARRHYRN